MTSLQDRAKFIDAWNRIAKEVHATATSKGFHTQANRVLDEISLTSPDLQFLENLILVKELALIAGEAHEATEAIRRGNAMSKKVPHKEVAEELADVVIRIMDTAAARGWPLAEAILDKMAYNATRPTLHGKAF